jgi:tetratricopeptide (TPR) repeat protein
LEIDLWWNLKTGEYIIKNLEIPRIDIFSYTLEDTPWIDHEWLSQVLFYLCFSTFGWLGLNILKALIISVSFFILFFLASSKFKKNIFPLLFLLMSVLAFGYRSFLRPEIFSYLFLCIFLYVLERERRLYILPFLQIIWVNLHGYFILGPFLALLYCIGDLISGDRNRAKRFAMVFALIVAACFINPYFYKGAFYPISILIDTVTEQRVLMQNIHELMMPIRSSYGRFLFFWNFAILTSITFIINLKNVKIKHILIFMTSFIASYIAVRNIPIFIFLAMPLGSMNLNRSGLTKKISEKNFYIMSILAICGLTYFFLSNKYYIFTNQYGLRKTESRFSRYFIPSGSCGFLEQNNIKGRLFNTIDFGPYIGYRFYPERRVFIDTRTDLYKDKFYRLYRRAQNYPADWERLYKQYGFKIAVLRHLFGGTEKILRYLHEHMDWRLVYYDENSCVFLSDVPENAEIIRRFEIDFSKKYLVDSDININIAGFFEKIEEGSLAEKIYIKLLEDDPGFLNAGNNLATIYINTGRYEEGIRLIKKFLRLYPRAPELYTNMGTAYLRMGRKEEGLILLEESARIDPYYRNTSYILGIVYLEKGDIDKAMRQFIKYSRLDPYNPEAHRILGDIYTQKGLLKEARSEYNEADALEGRDL